jgi:hypothetical protein
MLKAIKESMSWKKKLGRYPRILLKCILIFPFMKGLFTWIQFSGKDKLKVYRPLNPVTSMRNPDNPPMPHYSEDSW